MSAKRPKDLINDVTLFAKAYARKAQRGAEPNDRGYDRSIEHRIKHMKPEELSKLLNEESEESEEPVVISKEKNN